MILQLFQKMAILHLISLRYTVLFNKLSFCKCILSQFLVCYKLLHHILLFAQESLIWKRCIETSNQDDSQSYRFLTGPRRLTFGKKHFQCRYRGCIFLKIVFLILNFVSRLHNLAFLAAILQYPQAHNFNKGCRNEPVLKLL